MKKSYSLKRYFMSRFILISITIGVISQILNGALELFVSHNITIEIIPGDKVRDEKSAVIAIVFYFAFTLLNYVIFIKLFGKMLNEKIEVPINGITLGLKEISDGKLSTRLNFEIEDEFVEMRNSFNYMASEMEKAKEEKKQYEEERIHLFSNIVHDLKTPITTIAGYSKVLADGMVSNPEKQSEYLNTIHIKSQRINELLDLLFTYTKLENDQFQLKMEETDFVELVRENTALLYTDFEEKGIHLNVILPEKPIVMSLDKLEMGRALVNLLTNAIKHNDIGTLVLVEVKTGEKVSLVVADTGNPIRENILKDLFKPFVLGDESRSSKGGSGLGLTITKKIIQRHEGKIYLENKIPGFTKGFVIEF